MKDSTVRAISNTSNAQFLLWANIAGALLLVLLVLSFLLPQPGAFLLQVLVIALAVYGMRLLWVRVRSRQDF
jgi:hypothetical protein